MKENGHVTEVFTLIERENGHCIEVTSLIEGACSCNIGGQYNGGRMVMSQKWSF